MADRSLTVRIIGDDASLRAALLRDAKAVEKFGSVTTGRLEKVGSSFTKLQRVAAGGLVGGVAVAGLKSSVDAASDLNEQVTKAQALFGSSSAAIVGWSRTTADAFGVSQRAALEAAGGFGQLLETSGLTADKAAEMSKRLVGLGSDLASFNNIQVSDALDKLRSGLAGEAEPLRTLGVLLSDARVKAEAYAAGIAKQGSALTEGQKVQARFALILKDTATAQGDFERTSGGAANASRRLSANVENLRANLGSGLVPALAKTTGALAALTAGMQTAFVTAEQLANDRSLRDKFADAFGADELFKALNKIKSAGLTNRIDESFDRGIGGPTKKERVKSALDTILGPIDEITKLAKTDLAKATKEMSGAIDKAAADAKLEESFSKLLANLQLGVDRAGLTRRLDDDLKALNALKTGLQRQVKAGVDVQASQSQLVQVEAQILAKQQEIADKRARLQESLAKAEQARQFRLLGLDAEGNKPPPAIANLKKQLKQLSSRDDLTGDDKGVLARIRKVLVDPIHKATPETRDAINEMFATIRGAFDKGSEDLAKGPLTKTSGLNSKKLLAGLGLDPDTIRELQSRLSHFNSAGVALAGTQNLPTGMFRGGSSSTKALPPIDITLTMDGDVVARNVLRSNQKTARRNPLQKRGPNRSGV